MEVAPDANPPVCRIMDYNRFKYESAQRAKESRKKATSTSIKEMKYRPKIGSGDFTTKTRQVSRFLEEGHKVKVTIMFRGREVSHPELGMKILDDLADQVSSVAKVEAAPKLDGRNMVMVLAPDKRARQAARKTADLGQEAGVAPAATSAGSANDTEGEPESVAPATTEPAATQPGTTGPASTEPASTEPASTEPGATRPAAKAPASTRPAAPAPTATVSGGVPAGGGGSAAANGAASPRREPAPKHEPAGVAASASGASRAPVEDLAGQSS